MRTLLFALICLFSFAAVQLNAQKDPAAEKILAKLKSTYETEKPMEVDFTLTIRLADMEPEIQEGKLIQKGTSFYASLAGQEVYGNGDALWTYLESRNEVQITDMDGSAGGMASPKDLLTIYEKDDYSYALVGEVTDKAGIAYQQIEFVPREEDGEFFKIRLTVKKGDPQVKTMEAFSADGSRYILEIKKLKVGGTYPSSTFQFNAADYPGVRVEDLRL